MVKEVSRIEPLAIDRTLNERGESMRKYWQLEVKGAEASIFIYGDIVSEPWKWYESDVTSYDLVKEIEGLDVDVIHCYINSYGGEVAEGLAIYNALKRHKAKVRPTATALLAPLPAWCSWPAMNASCLHRPCS